MLCFQFGDYLKSTYGSCLVYLEDTVKQYSDCKIRQQKLTNHNNDTNNNVPEIEIYAIESEIDRFSIEIVELFTDYVNYLNKINQYLSIWYVLINFLGSFVFFNFFNLV